VLGKFRNPAELQRQGYGRRIEVGQRLLAVDIDGESAGQLLFLDKILTDFFFCNNCMDAGRPG